MARPATAAHRSRGRSWASRSTARPKASTSTGASISPKLSKRALEGVNTLEHAARGLDGIAARGLGFALGVAPDLLGLALGSL